MEDVDTDQLEALARDLKAARKREKEAGARLEEAELAAQQARAAVRTAMEDVVRLRNQAAALLQPVEAPRLALEAVPAPSPAPEPKAAPRAPRANGDPFSAHPNLRRYEGQLLGDILRVMLTKEGPIHRTTMLEEAVEVAKAHGRKTNLESMKTAFKRACQDGVLNALPERRGYCRVAPKYAS